MSEHSGESKSAVESAIDKTTGKLQVHESSSSSSSSSDSDDEKSSVAVAPSPSSCPPIKSKIYHLFGREQPVHKVLGGGKTADVLLWRNKKIPASSLGVATVIWILFELLEFHLLAVVCHILIFALAILFLWSNATTFINKVPPHIPEVQIPEKAVLEFVSALILEINRSLAVLREIASGNELKKFLAVIAGLWVVSVLGSWINFLTLFYTMFVLLHTVPVLYEKYEDRVDAFAERAAAELKKHYAVVDARVLSRIPRGPLKGKKLE
ncbi:hypothetical protein Nepgr_021472 [Nepenthes gracilis]|uniref:Reticulon-like protein n=1 Tax=Nepenthes gracilis TaxID=150966 RepID=A0AAD3SZ47_NEPGR|nr:hypothetical protein Nepgr_021472 [Nepenthes gracilis]